MNFTRMKNKKRAVFLFLLLLFSAGASAQYGIFAGTYEAKDSTKTMKIVLTENTFIQEYNSPKGRFYSEGSYNVLKDTFYLERKKLIIKKDAKKFFNQKFIMQASCKIWMNQGRLYTFRDQQGLYQNYLILKKLNSK
ncbi:MAG: hypothetical protein V2A54_08315 [Bacteroidota bacterium]